MTDTTKCNSCGQWKDISKLLLTLLDDIDTLDDAAKDNDAVFRKLCYSIQRKRFEVVNVNELYNEEEKNHG